jgi:hypothetical protein
LLLFSLYGSQDGEVFALTWQDLDLTNKLLYVRNPKNDEARQAYLTPNLLVILGIAIVCFSIIPKPPEEWTNSSVKNLTVFRPLRPSGELTDQAP